MKLGRRKAEIVDERECTKIEELIRSYFIIFVCNYCNYASIPWNFYEDLVVYIYIYIIQLAIKIVEINFSCNSNLLVSTIRHITI